MDTATTIILVIAILALAGVLYLLFERRRRENVKAKFGPEYDRVVSEEGTARNAVHVLEERKRRVEKYPLRALSREESLRFAQRWKSAQGRFVDDPRGAVWEADRLVNEALQAQGYPMSDFDHQAADISVNHPRLVDEFRMGHRIAVASQQGECSTEDLRVAMQRYRNLFKDISNVDIAQEVHR